MSQPIVLDWRRVSPESDFKFLPPRSNPQVSGIYSVSLQVRDPDSGEYVPFIHQTPKLRIPFGISESDNSGKPKYSCDMSFPQVLQNAETEEFEGDEELVEYVKWLQRVDNSLKAAALEKVNEWFRNKNKKKEFTAEDIDRLFFKNLKPSSRPQQYSPTFTTRLLYDMKKNAFETDFYGLCNQKVKPMKYEELRAGMDVITILQAKSLWFAAGNFGLSYKVKQLVAYQRSEFQGPAFKIPGVVFEPAEAAPQEEETDNPASAIAENFVVPPDAKRPRLE